MTDSEDPEIAPICRDPRSETDRKRCAECGTALDPTRRTPAATARASPTTIYLFCSERCREAWTTDDADR